jgi:Doubled CXXCH motif (Paired_CXXCH_1)
MMLTALVVAASIIASPDTGFDHQVHAKLFPLCSTCHAGVTESRASLWPTPESCAQCHDGKIQPAVRWQPPMGPSPTNLRFSHGDHLAVYRRAKPGTNRPTCSDCHSPAGASWMTVRRTVSRQCLECHGITADHFAAPDTACATCHMPLATVAGFTREHVARFKAPPSHQDPEFASRGHGKLAQPPSENGRSFAIAPSCATCHARDFCIVCHVNAPETRTIQGLGPDPRSLAIPATLEAPASHAATDFLTTHGKASRRSTQACQTCHTRESCLTCHNGQPDLAKAMFAAGPGRGPGAQLIRHAPITHTAYWDEQHADMARSRARNCLGCHTRTQCLDCHRPNPGDATGYHAAGFLTRHPAAAYAREADCSNCHNNQQFCASCHQQSGLVSSGQLNPGYHDANRFFGAGHGQAARQSLETCVACHSERDCLQCHSALGSRSFNPHGPGFDADKLRKRNPQMCSGCHGQAIPGQ